MSAAVFCPFSGKESFATRKAAKNHAFFMERKRRLRRKSLRAYRCDGCGRSHISTAKWGKVPELIEMVRRQSAEHRVLRIILEIARERGSD
jgi:hypothetical protein